MMKRAVAGVLLVLALGGCPPEDDGAPVAEDGGTEDAADAAAEAFACGPSLTCPSGQVCQGVGQGACGGPPPDADGHCAPGCSPMECGGGTHCLCTSFTCTELPQGCQGCDCTWPDWRTSCHCDDSTGEVVLECPGA